MKSCLPLLLLAALPACKTTDPTMVKDGKPELDPKDVVHVSSDDMRPMQRFVLETKRVIAAEMIRVDMSEQFFREKMGLSRDRRYVEKVERTARDGARVLILRNRSGQTTNIDPNILPRISFGSGLELRAYNEIRIYFSRGDKEKPIFIKVRAHTPEGNSKMWVQGRMETEQPTIQLRSELLWDEYWERYRHKGAVD